tara:strand:+ start:194 stop:511 length:318 start_codon:yes stop_codon:yes gene_type:complete
MKKTIVFSLLCVAATSITLSPLTLATEDSCTVNLKRALAVRQCQISMFDSKAITEPAHGRLTEFENMRSTRPDCIVLQSEPELTNALVSAPEDKLVDPTHCKLKR